MGSDHVCGFQELNNRLAAEITKMRSMSTDEGESGTVIMGKELYELEVPHTRTHTHIYLHLALIRYLFRVIVN